jgi:hypothetical protein
MIRPSPGGREVKTTQQEHRGTWKEISWQVRRDGLRVGAEGEKGDH